MSIVEQRVASEVKAWLAGYRANSACKCYPWAASFIINIVNTVCPDSTNARCPGCSNQSVSGLNRGRFRSRRGRKTGARLSTGPSPSARRHSSATIVVWH